MASEEDLKKIVQSTKKGLEKNKFVSIHMAGDPGIASHIPFTIPTGLPQLDFHLGGKGGLPAGKIITYFGLPGTGKTTLAIHALAECQRMGGLTLFVDGEQTFDEERAEELGINLDLLSVASAYSIESIFNTLEEFLTSVDESKFNGPILMVVDSITGVPTEFDQAQEMTSEMRIGQESKQIRRGVRRLQGMLSKTKASVIFINHSVSKMAKMPFAKQTQSAGGFGIKFMEYARVELKKAGTIKSGETRLGDDINIEIEKLKNAPLPYPRIKDIQLLDNGYNSCLSLLHAALKTGMISKTKTGKVCTMFEGTDRQMQFDMDEWSQVVEQMGGYRKMYDTWLEHATQAGVMKLWNK